MVISAWQPFFETSAGKVTDPSLIETVKPRKIRSSSTRTKRKRMSPSERRKKIIQGTLKVVAQKGFWGMSLQDVADEAGITEAGLYHYINTKDDLLEMLLTEAYDTPEADRFNAQLASATDSCGHTSFYYPRYCLNIVMYNTKRAQMVQLFSTLMGEALNPQHPAHTYFINRHQKYWKLIKTMTWALPEGYTERKFYDLYTLAMSAMDGLQYRWLADSSISLLDEWARFSDLIFPESEWKGCLDPSEFSPDQGCLDSTSLHFASEE